MKLSWLCKGESDKNKMEDEKDMQETACDCPECARRAEEHAESETFGLAVLIALMPIMTLTLFGHIGLL